MVNSTPLLRRGTILYYNGDGTVRVAVDERRLGEQKLEYNVDIPLAWSGPNGEIMGGFPTQGASITMSRGHGGEWFISSYIKSNNVFINQNVFGTGGLSRDLMSDLTPGRILLQTASVESNTAPNRLFVDPKDGINIGTSDSFARLDPHLDIISHTYSTQLEFTSAHRAIVGSIKRDIQQTPSRNRSESILTSHEYSDQLSPVGMDPSSGISIRTTGGYTRNLPLAENREVVYEFSNDESLNFTYDSKEIDLYQPGAKPKAQSSVLRTDSRADSFNISLGYPNNLIETIKGTGVDSLGNIIDLNRNVIPIGMEDEFSFNSNQEGNADAFTKIRALHRKALAYHFEINARKRTGKEKEEVAQLPNVLAVNDVTKKSPDHARDRSRFFIDVDKEGQFKINIPSSSETGNIPLLTRYETASSILFAQGDITDPSVFSRFTVDGEEINRDIFHDDFANDSPIFVTDFSPNDRLREDTPIKTGTAYHNILETCLQFQNREAGLLIPYMPDSSLNTLEPIDTIASDVIIPKGPEANAGGRSGMISMDGFLSLNIGANTIDRQSVWADYAGGIVANIGRDLRGRSYIGNYDGDVFIQIGGSSIGNSTDSRFDDQNDAFRQGVFDMRVVQGSSQGSNGGQLLVIRADGEGLKIASYGRVEISASQDMVFRTRGTMHFDCEEAIMFSGSKNQRRILRNGKEM